MVGSNIPGAMRCYLFCRDRIAWANNVLLARCSFFFLLLKTSFHIINDTYFFTTAFMAQKDVCMTKKRRKSMVFLGISIVICWIMFAKESEKSDELIHSHERT